MKKIIFLSFFSLLFIANIYTQTEEDFFGKWVNTAIIVNGVDQLDKTKLSYFILNSDGTSEYGVEEIGYKPQLGKWSFISPNLIYLPLVADDGFKYTMKFTFINGRLRSNFDYSLNIYWEKEISENKSFSQETDTDISKSESQVTDKDGNTYKTVTIGTQEWTAENLNVEHYCNGDVIPQVQNADKWSNLTSGAWCYYDNKTSNGKIYGKLYNWYAVNDPRGLAPEGWHIPSDAEWTKLTDYLGGAKTAGEKMKSTSGWNAGGNGTNNSGLTAFPGGCRSDQGGYYKVGKYGLFWSASEDGTKYAWYRYLSYDRSDVYRYYYPSNGWNGFSVRCVRD